MLTSQRGQLYSLRFDVNSSRCRFRGSENAVILPANTKASCSLKQNGGVRVASSLYGSFWTDHLQ